VSFADCWKDPDSPSILKPNGQLGDYHCDSSMDLISSVLGFMKSKMGDNIDFILWTGNSVPQSPNFPVANASAHETVLQRVTEMFHHNFPYTTVYPALGNLDVMHPNILQRGDSREEKHHNKRGRNQKKSWNRKHSNLDTQDIKTTYRHVAHLWQNWLPPTAIPTLEKGGYYTIELAGSRIRLVALNMNLYMEDIMDEMKFRRTDLRGRGVLLKGGRPGDPSLGAVTDPDPMGQWAWLSKVMETAKKKQQNVIIFGHSPPGKYERSFQVSRGASTSIDSNSQQWSQHWLQERFNHRYLEFVRKYSNLIVGQYFGHQHSDSFRIFKDEKGKPISWALLNPSVSPFKVSANGMVVESSNPAVRLYRYNTFTGEIFDYAQYYLDLADANRKVAEANMKEGNGGLDSINSISSSIEAVHVGSSPDEAAASSLTSAGALGDLHQTFMRPPSQHGLWRVEYNFTSLYDVPDITPTSMEDISLRLKNNKTWFDAYFRTNMVNFENPWACDAMCRHVHTCAITYIDYSDYTYCVDKAASLNPDQSHVNRAAFGLIPTTWLMLLITISLVASIIR